MGKDDYDPASLPQTPPNVLSPIRSPTWSPISPLGAKSPAGSAPNRNLLNSILIDTGIYSPRRNAEVPVGQETWEISTASASASFALPPSTSGTQNGKEKIGCKNKRAPRKSAGVAFKAKHLVWIEEEGLPNLKARLQEQKLLLDTVLQDISSLDMQMRAIKIMQSKDDFKKACETHVDTKLQLTIKKAKCRKEIQKYHAEDAANIGSGIGEKWEG